MTERHPYGAVIFARSETDDVPFMWIGTARPSFWEDAAYVLDPDGNNVEASFRG